MSSTRARRSTAKAVDYAREQEFSDDDIFEDGLNDNDSDEPVQQASRRKSRPRKSNASSYDVSADYGGGGSGYEIPEKYRYYEKGYDMNLPHIRERFDFMPELELDGTPKADLIVGRRLIDDGDDNNSSNEGDTSNIDSTNHDSDDDMDDEDDTSSRKRRTSRKKSETKNKKTSKDEPKKHHAEYEYLVKYKGKSYLHLEWKAASELESLNKSAKNLYRRFLKKLQTGVDEDLEDPDFDPSFIQPQRIVDEDEHEVTVELDDEELAEWEKQQQKQLQEQESSSDEENSEDEEEKETQPDLQPENVEAKVEEDTGSEEAESKTNQPFHFLQFSQVHLFILIL